MNELISTKDGMTSLQLLEQITAKMKLLLMNELDQVLREYMNNELNKSDALKEIKQLKDEMYQFDEPFTDILNAAEMFILFMETDFYERKDAASNILYVIEFSNNTVKIGVTSNFEKRKKQIEHQSGLIAKKWRLFPDFDNARNSESAAHKYFAAKRLNGEYFSIRFDEAVEYVKSSL